MRDFLKRYNGREASTADFQRVVEEHVAGDWQTFFDTWVYDTTVPTYTWTWTCPKTPGPDGRFDLAVNVKQSDVPDGFKAFVPVRAEFGEKAGTIFLPMDAPEKTFHIWIPAPAKKVVFDPRHAVVARVKG
jgi:aminopeptidase N